MDPAFLYCSDCGGRLTLGSRRGCCVSLDEEGQPLPAGVMFPLDWEELDEPERELVAALVAFPDGQAQEEELLERLQWPRTLLDQVAAERGRSAAKVSCCLVDGDTVTLTDQARDAYPQFSNPGPRSRTTWPAPEE